MLLWNKIIAYLNVIPIVILSHKFFMENGGDFVLPETAAMFVVSIIIWGAQNSVQLLRKKASTNQDFSYSELIVIVLPLLSFSIMISIIIQTFLSYA